MLIQTCISLCVYFGRGYHELELSTLKEAEKVEKVEEAENVEKVKVAKVCAAAGLVGGLLLILAKI